MNVDDLDKCENRVKSARVINVIEVVVDEGNGKDTTFREVRYYFTTVGGLLLAKYDPREH